MPKHKVKTYHYDQQKIPVEFIVFPGQGSNRPFGLSPDFPRLPIKHGTFNWLLLKLSSSPKPYPAKPGGVNTPCVHRLAKRSNRTVAGSIRYGATARLSLPMGTPDVPQDSRLSPNAWQAIHSVSDLYEG